MGLCQYSIHCIQSVKFEIWYQCVRTTIDGWAVLSQFVLQHLPERTCKERKQQPMNPIIAVNGFCTLLADKLAWGIIPLFIALLAVVGATYFFVRFIKWAWNRKH